MITIKEEFIACEKWLLAVELGGSDAIVLWLCIKGYCAASLTDGFISAKMIARLPGVPKRWKKALNALVNCGRTLPDGSQGAGLLDEEPHGFRLHNYLDHATSRTEEEEKRRRAREKQALYRKRQRDHATLPTVTGNATGDRPVTLPVTNHGVTHPLRGGAPADPRDSSPLLSSRKSSNLVEVDPKTSQVRDGTQGPDDPPPPTRTQNPDRARAADQAITELTPPKPTNLAEALKVPLDQRANLVLSEPYSDEWLRARDWPELVSVVTALHSAAGLSPPHLGRYQADGAVRAAVALFAAGVTPEQLLERIPRIVATDWWREKRRDFGAVTLTVFRRAERSQRPAEGRSEADIQRDRDRLEAMRQQRAAAMAAQCPAGSREQLAELIGKIGQ